MRETPEERSERLLKSIQEQKIGLDEPFKSRCSKYDLFFALRDVTD